MQYLGGRPARLLAEAPCDGITHAVVVLVIGDEEYVDAGQIALEPLPYHHAAVFVALLLVAPYARPGMPPRLLLFAPPGAHLLYMPYHLLVRHGGERSRNLFFRTGGLFGCLCHSRRMRFGQLRQCLYPLCLFGPRHCDFLPSGSGAGFPPRPADMTQLRAQ